MPMGITTTASRANEKPIAVKIPKYRNILTNKLLKKELKFT